MNSSNVYAFKSMSRKRLMWSNGDSSIYYTLNDQQFTNYTKCLRLTCGRTGYSCLDNVIYFLNYRFTIVNKRCVVDMINHRKHCWIHKKIKRCCIDDVDTFLRLEPFDFDFLGSVNRVCDNPTKYSFRCNNHILTFKKNGRTVVFRSNGKRLHQFTNLHIFKLVSESTTSDPICVLNINGEIVHFNTKTLETNGAHRDSTPRYKTWSGGKLFKDITVTISFDNHIIINTIRRDVQVDGFKFVANGMMYKESSSDKYYIVVFIPWGTSGVSMIKREISMDEYRYDMDMEYFCYTPSTQTFVIKRRRYTKLITSTGTNTLVYPFQDGLKLYISNTYNFIVNQNDQIIMVGGMHASMLNDSSVSINIDMDKVDFVNAASNDPGDDTENNDNINDILKSEP